VAKRRGAKIALFDGASHRPERWDPVEKEMKPSFGHFLVTTGANGEGIERGRAGGTFTGGLGAARIQTSLAKARALNSSSDFHFSWIAELSAASRRVAAANALQRTADMGAVLFLRRKLCSGRGSIERV